VSNAEAKNVATAKQDKNPSRGSAGPYVLVFSSLPL